MNKQKSVQNDDFNELNYSQMPDEVKNVVKPEPFITEKSTTIVSDGKQLLVRIPKKIEKQYSIKKRDKMNFKLIVNNPENPNLNKLEITIERVD